MTRDANPQQTLELLRTLADLGFTDQAFALLHHFRVRKTIARMSDHWYYCEQIDSYEGDGENERLHYRLQLVLDAWHAGGLDFGDPGAVHALADAAYRQIPPLSGYRSPAPAVAARAKAAIS